VSFRIFECDCSADSYRQTHPLESRIITMITRWTLPRMVRLGLSLSLSLWIAGFGCVIGCESLVAKASTGSTRKQRDCHTAKRSPQVTTGHSCCVKHRLDKTQREATLALLEVERSVQECPFAVTAKALSARPRSDEATTVQTSPIPRLPPVALSQSLNHSVPSFLYNRGSTHLRCCVFLI